MEDNIQAILIFLISTVLLFIFPVYMAYEKKDDVSYALALKFTQEFVETVGEKGYLTLDEYADFRKKLITSGNLYDIELEHKYTSTIPALKYYKEDEGEYEYIDSTNFGSTLVPEEYDKINTYELTTEVFKTEHIVNILNKTKIYTLNENDIFTVRVKNTNKTLATIMYNMIAFNTSTTRIYVNCSKTVTDTKWYQKEDLEYLVGDLGTSETLQKRLLSKEDPLIFMDNFRGTSQSIFNFKAVEDPIIGYNYNIECKVYPIKNTRIDLVGTEIDGSVTGYNIYIDNIQKRAGILSISIGVNGIVVHQTISRDGSKKTVLSYEGLITPNTLIEMAVKEKEIALFIDGKRVSESKLSRSAILTKASSFISEDFGGPTDEESETTYDTIDDKIYKVYPTYFKVYKTIE